MATRCGTITFRRHYITMIAEQKTVLVAEDDMLVRMTAVEALADAGFVVVGAQDADDAFAILNSHAEQIHLLFTDIEMPGSMNGLELARQVHEAWPNVALLIVSGQLEPNKEEMPKGSRFLPKPYDLNDCVGGGRSVDCGYVQAGRRDAAHRDAVSVVG